MNELNWIEKLALSCDVKEIPSNEILEVSGIQYDMTDACPILCTNINEVDNVSYLLSMTKDKLADFMINHIDEIFTNEKEYLYTIPEVILILNPLVGLGSMDYIRINDKITGKFQKPLMYDSFILNIYTYINTRNYQNLKYKHMKDRISKASGIEL